MKFVVALALLVASVACVAETRPARKDLCVELGGGLGVGSGCRRRHGLSGVVVAPGLGRTWSWAHVLGLGLVRVLLMARALGLARVMKRAHMMGLVMGQAQAVVKDMERAMGQEKAMGLARTL